VLSQVPIGITTILAHISVQDAPHHFSLQNQSLILEQVGQASQKLLQKITLQQPQTPDFSRFAQRCIVLLVVDTWVMSLMMVQQKHTKVLMEMFQQLVCVIASTLSPSNLWKREVEVLRRVEINPKMVKKKRMNEDFFSSFSPLLSSSSRQSR